MDKVYLDSLWVLFSASTVFFMQAGFMCFEVGAVREKSVTSVAIKNVIDWVVVGLGFYVIGFGVMFGTSQGGWFGTSLFAPVHFEGEHGALRGFTFVIFQTAFATTAATIVSGALAERIRFINYILISLFVGVLVYPVYGHWVWGNAWNAGNQPLLGSMGFIDFAGSSVVHLVGAAVAVVGVAIVGPRIGRYNEQGELSSEFNVYSVPWMVLGTLILSFGWWGFNGGSVLAFDGRVPAVILNTYLAAIAGGGAGIGHAWFFQGKDGLNEKLLGGLLGGLVAITACAHIVSPTDSILVGLAAGVVHNLAFDLITKRFQLDDPVGAIPVHGACGMWGLIAVALLGDTAVFDGRTRLEQLVVQLTGIAACIGWSVSLAYVAFTAMRATVGLRVSAEAELGGISLASETQAAAPAQADDLAELQALLLGGAPANENDEGSSTSEDEQTDIKSAVGQ